MKIKTNNRGFTLIEVLMYFSITAILITLVASMALNMFNAARAVRASNAVYQNARLINNYFMNRLHNVDLIVLVAGVTENVHFYELPAKRWSLTAENGDLVLREVTNTGTGFPPQATAIPVILNSQDVNIDSITMTPYDNNYGAPNRGVMMQITISSAFNGGQFSQLTKTFDIFASLR